MKIKRTSLVYMLGVSMIGLFAKWGWAEQACKCWVVYEQTLSGYYEILHTSSSCGSIEEQSVIIGRPGQSGAPAYIGQCSSAMAESTDYGILS